MAKEFSNVEAFIRKYGLEVETEIKNRLKGANKVATGKLYRSIKFNIRQSVKELEASWRMEDYGLYVDKGISGAGIPEGFQGKMKTLVRNGEFRFKDKMPPKGSLRKWFKARSVDKKYDFAIRRSIWIFGIAPTNFFTIPTRRRQKQFEAGLEKAMVKDLDIMIEKQIK